MKEKRYFQFIASPRKGEVLVFDKIEEEGDMVFVSFTDKSRCNEELILPINQTSPGNMLMAEVENTKNIWTFKEDWIGREEEKWEKNEKGENVCVQPFVEGRKKLIQFPPKKSVAKFGQIDQQPSELVKPIEDHSDDPVWVMMSKSKKFDTQIPMELTISLPSKALYNVAKESFEDGSKKVIEYIISNIDDTKLKENLKYALLEAYEDIDEIPKTFKPQAQGISRNEIISEEK